MEQSSTRDALQAAQRTQSSVNPWPRMSPKVRIGPATTLSFRARGIGANGQVGLPAERCARRFQHKQFFMNEAPRFDAAQVAFPAQFPNC